MKRTYEATVLLVAGAGNVAATVGQVIATIPGCTLLRIGTADEALAWLRRRRAAIILIYVGEDDRRSETLGLLQQLRELPVKVPVVVLSECDDAELRLQTLTLGAIDCLSRPWQLSRLALLVDLLTVPARRLPPPADSGDEAFDDGGMIAVGDGLLFDDGATAKLLEQFRRVAPLETTVLLAGGTGTGKTSVARLLHDLSPRRRQPFVVVHCGASNPTLLASELFGHVRGAFTSADRDSTGKFTEAGEGTVLLDEIDCIPPEAQAKLLRAVEERAYEAVGSLRTLHLRARLVVTSNRDLQAEVAAGRFRADLYYRLNVISFVLPPLCERETLIEPLAHKFIAEFAERQDIAPPGISPDALVALQRYDWPGNVRELRNVIERAVALGAGSIAMEDLPEPIQRALASEWSADPHEGHGPHHGKPVHGPLPGARNGLDRVRKEAERKRLVDALHRHENNRTEAAAELGISRVTLYKKLRRYGLNGSL